MSLFVHYFIDRQFTDISRASEPVWAGEAKCWFHASVADGGMTSLNTIDVLCWNACKMSTLTWHSDCKNTAVVVV